jgi:hypothetical protein
MDGQSNYVITNNGIVSEEEHVAHCKKLMEEIDWHFEMCDDHSKWRKNGELFRKIGEELNLLDFSKAEELWRAHAPRDYQPYRRWPSGRN